MFKAFLYGAIEMGCEGRQFKVNGQRLQPYMEGVVDSLKSVITLVDPR